MIDPAELPTDESGRGVPDRLYENDAVARCVRAWQITLKKECPELDDSDSEFEAKEAANCAYLHALPPLSGYQNICDFIACVSNGSMVGAILQRDAEHLLASAKIALGALRFNPKPAGIAPRRPGRPRKNPRNGGK
jgi:hypothetical protein